MEFDLHEAPSSSDEDDFSSNSSSDGEEWDVEATFDSLNVEHEDRAVCISEPRKGTDS
jgi:hypothetical protein